MTKPSQLQHDGKRKVFVGVDFGQRRDVNWANNGLLAFVALDGTLNLLFVRRRIKLRMQEVFVPQRGITLKEAIIGNSQLLGPHDGPHRNTRANKASLPATYASSLDDPGPRTMEMAKQIGFFRCRQSWQRFTHFKQRAHMIKLSRIFDPRKSSPATPPAMN